MLLVVLLGASSSQALSVSFAWDYTQGPDPAVVFKMYRQQNCAGNFVLIGSVTVPTQVFTDTSVVLGQQYCWYVTAANAVGLESGPSNTVRLFLSTPAVPTNLRSTVNP